MKERNKKHSQQLAEVNDALDFVNYLAQDAILDPNLPDVFKEEFLNIAINEIWKAAEVKAAYYAKYGEGRRTRRPR